MCVSCQDAPGKLASASCFAGVCCGYGRSCVRQRALRQDLAPPGMPRDKAETIFGARLGGLRPTRRKKSLCGCWVCVKFVMYLTHTNFFSSTHTNFFSCLRHPKKVCVGTVCTRGIQGLNWALQMGTLRLPKLKGSSVRFLFRERNFHPEGL